MGDFFKSRPLRRELVFAPDFPGLRSPSYLFPGFFENVFAMSTSTSISLRPEHLKDDEVRFISGALKSNITIDRDNCDQEQISYWPLREDRMEAALAHTHGPVVFELDAEGDDVDEALKLADAHFCLDTSLKQKYPGGPWSNRTEDGADWEGQRSILVGRCDGAVVGVACLRMFFVTPYKSARAKVLAIGIGPFFVPPNMRGRAHAIEMSIASSRLGSALLLALYSQLPKFWSMHVLLAFDCSDYYKETHPFVEQIFKKS